MAEKKEEPRRDGIRSVWTIGNTIKVSFTAGGVDCFVEVGLLELKKLLNSHAAHGHQVSKKPDPPSCPTGRCDL